MNLINNSMSISVQNQQLAYIGDAALLWVTRAALIKKYSNLPFKFLMQREQIIVNNSNLTRWCKKKGLYFGCNLFEAHFHKIVQGDLGGARKIVDELMEQSEPLKRLDEEQLINGKLNEATMARLSAREKRIAESEKLD